jgi:hypothetical protein
VENLKPLKTIIRQRDLSKVFAVQPKLSQLLKTYPFLGESNRCPTCRKLFVDLDSIAVLHGLGECLNCDHVRGDLC